ncbi:MAG: cell wall-active antibiotics response protein [Anaerolineaceae bacterium]|nr:cell wall-active antibiotics response protein [Anaerolineaceae bacterium]
MKKWQFIFGVFLLSMGVFALIKVIFNIDIWIFIWPLILIGIGVLIIFRPNFAGNDTKVTMILIGDIRREGEWEMKLEEYWLTVGKVTLDLSMAIIPEGVTLQKLFLIAGDVVIRVPSNIGLLVDCNAIVSSIKIKKNEQNGLIQTNSFKSSDYELKEKKVKVETFGVVNSIVIKEINL